MVCQIRDLGHLPLLFLGMHPLGTFLLHYDLKNLIHVERPLVDTAVHRISYTPNWQLSITASHIKWASKPSWGFGVLMSYFMINWPFYQKIMHLFWDQCLNKFWDGVLYSSWWLEHWFFFLKHDNIRGICLLCHLWRIGFQLWRRWRPWLGNQCCKSRVFLSLSFIHSLNKYLLSNSIQYTRFVKAIYHLAMELQK